MSEITFVVGAGASSEFGLPTGKRLLEVIANLARVERTNDVSRFKLDPSVDTAINKLLHPDGPFKQLENRHFTAQQEACWLAEVALMAPSIDNLLHSHRDRLLIDKIGKLFICSSIVSAEAGSFLANVTFGHEAPAHFALAKRYPGNRIEYISEKWIGKLFSLLVEMRDFKEFVLVLGRVNFICFNYDRCIEMALTSLAMRYYKLSDDDGRWVLNSLKVTHVYGHLGPLSVRGGHIVGFGETTSDLLLAANNISTFTDSLAREKVSGEIQSAFKRSDVAVFLGYGFLEINNQLLFENARYDYKRVIATALGLSTASRDTLRSDLEWAFLYGNSSDTARIEMIGNGRPDKVNLDELRCSEVFDFHSLFLRRFFAS